jgi:hypothetical protein
MRLLHRRPYIEKPSTEKPYIGNPLQEKPSIQKPPSETPLGDPVTLDLGFITRATLPFQI